MSAGYSVATRELTSSPPESDARGYQQSVQVTRSCSKAAASRPSSSRNYSGLRLPAMSSRHSHRVRTPGTREAGRMVAVPQEDQACSRLVVERRSSGGVHYERSFWWTLPCRETACLTVAWCESQPLASRHGGRLQVCGLSEMSRKAISGLRLAVWRFPRPQEPRCSFGSSSFGDRLRRSRWLRVAKTKCVPWQVGGEGGLSAYRLINCWAAANGLDGIAMGNKVYEGNLQPQLSPPTAFVAVWCHASDAKGQRQGGISVRTEKMTAGLSGESGSGNRRDRRKRLRSHPVPRQALDVDGR